MRDLMVPGLLDDVPHALSRNATVLELPVDYGEGQAYKIRPTVVVSRPLLWSAYDLVFFSDISTGEALQGDSRLVYPSTAGLTNGSFVKARIWTAAADQVRGYNRDRMRPLRLHLEDMKQVSTGIDAAHEIGVSPAWQALQRY